MPRHHCPPALRCVEVQACVRYAGGRGDCVVLPCSRVRRNATAFRWTWPRARPIAFDKPEQLLIDDVAAQIDAFVADKHMRAGNQRFHFMLGLATEGAIENGWRRWTPVLDGRARPRLCRIDLGGQDVPVLVAER